MDSLKTNELTSEALLLSFLQGKDAVGDKQQLLREWMGKSKERESLE